MARIGLYTTCCVVLMAVGCQQKDLPAPKGNAPSHVTQVSTENEKLPKVKPAVVPNADNKKSELPKGDSPNDRKQQSTAGTSQDSPADSHVDHPFEPPFGDRVDLFLPPERGTVNVERPTTSVSAVPDVKLKGFVKVGQQKAVLLIGKDVSFLAEGQEKEGIQVISIEPPLVTLQSGRSRWTVSLFQEKKEN